MKKTPICENALSAARMMRIMDDNLTLASLWAHAAYMGIRKVQRNPSVMTTFMEWNVYYRRAFPKFKSYQAAVSSL